MDVTNPYWWAQPVATVGAALIALAAAGIAYWGVSRQIKANTANVRKQIDAGAQNLREQLEAMERHRSDDRADEWLRLARTERRELLFDAYRLGARLDRSATDNFVLSGTSEIARERNETELVETANTAAAHVSELRLVELNDVAEALDRVIDLALDVWLGDKNVRPMALHRALETVHQAVRKELAIAALGDGPTADEPVAAGD
ncbi:hypothetical protein [Gordonia sp. NPDC127522]|uniref:hypothetical protein n=1 Tax=Gordonia sp. NPDC127522 TaxID=3345390 RepID=UPI0036297A4A